MKKFLSLVLALVMTMSLVTIGAGATEYKDLTDKSEIKYSEAVAVLNKLGIITGYEDGSFKPTNNLTRGAAAKIIVSLMIGSEAASALTVNAAPYKDVPVTNTFAAVISYCKTAGYISGYADGSFRPGDPLTGYAFSKMLLGALGYSSKIEGFTGSGWTMNVAKLSNKAGLLNGIVDFKGNVAVTRETAAQLSLNTLKATNVEYAGSDVTVKGDGIDVTVGNSAYTYVTSNNAAINKNIGRGDPVGASGSNYYTLEFGEEHFPALKLTNEGDARDAFNRPSNKWSYKNVAIGTYALTPDYVYTKGAEGATAADKVKDMGIKGFTVAPNAYYENNKTVAFGTTNNQSRLEAIANLTDNGVRVELFMDPDHADTIESVVVVYTQLMQVNSVKSNEVTLKRLEDDSKNGTTPATQVAVGTTAGFISVTTVKEDAASFKTLKDMKADDYVLVVPVLDGSTYHVASVTAPKTATGKMTNIATKGTDRAVKSVTVGGTVYGMSNTWTSEGDKLSNSTILSDKVDTNVYLDTYGYAIYVKNVQAANGAIIIERMYSSLVDGKIVKAAQGWDASGEALTINLGSAPTFSDGTPLPGSFDTVLRGTVYEYVPVTTGDAEYALVKHALTAPGTPTDGRVYAPSQAQWIENGQFQADILAGTNDKDTNLGVFAIPMASDVKFIFLSTANNSSNSEVLGINVRNGVTAIGENKNNDSIYDAPSLPADPADDVLYNINYILNAAKTKVIAVVVANDIDAAVTANLIYVEETNEHWNDPNDGNRMKSMFKAYDAKGELLDDGHSKYNKNVTGSALAGKFFTYTKDANDVYSLTQYNQTTKATSIRTLSTVTYSGANGVNERGYFVVGGVPTYNAAAAKVVDLVPDDGLSINSMSDLYNALKDGKADDFDVKFIYNGASNTAGFNTVSCVYVVASTVPNGTLTTGTHANIKLAATQAGLASAVSGAAIRVLPGADVFVEANSAAPGYTINVAATTANGVTLTHVSGGIYKFTMPATAIGNNKIIAVANLSYNSVVTLAGDGKLEVEANGDNVAQQAKAIQDYLTTAPKFYTNVQVTAGATRINTVSANLNGLPITWSASDIIYMVTYTVNGAGNEFITRPGTQIKDLPGLNGNYVKVNGIINTTAITSNATVVTENMAILDGFYKVDGALDNAVAAQIGGAGATYTYATTLTTGADGVKSGAAWYVKNGEVLKITFTSATAPTSTKTDTITVTAAGTTVFGTAAFIEGIDSAGTSKSVTLTIGTSDSTVSLSCVVS